MNLSEASLTELVAELRERLRHFAAGPPGKPAPAETPGPLGPAGRAALAARLLAVVLTSRRGRDAVEAASAFETLAETLAVAPGPLPGSAWEADLGVLASSFETIAGAWDRGDDRELVAAWRDLRVVGDRLWNRPPPPGAPAAEPPRSRAVAVGADPSPVDRRAVWLLVAGSIRRASLRKRLQAAGFVVDCPEDAEQAIERLGRERPAALLCDDAAPSRFRSRLLGRLPATAPPVILIRVRTGAVDHDESVWLPPYDTDELRERLGD